MAEAVEVAIRTKKHLAVQAGTGTGKTLGYLVPSILAGKRTIVATATMVYPHTRPDAPILATTLTKLRAASPSKNRRGTRSSAEDLVQEMHGEAADTQVFVRARRVSDVAVSGVTLFVSKAIDCHG